MIEAMTKTVDDRLKDDRGIESIVEGNHGLHSLSSILLALARANQSVVYIKFYV